MKRRFAVLFCALGLPTVFAACPPPVATCSGCTLPAGQAAQPYRNALSGNIGLYSVITGVTGTVPPGMTLSIVDNGTGDSKRPKVLVLAGTPSQTGIYVFNYKYEDRTVGAAIQYIPGYGNYLTQKIEIADCVGVSALPGTLPYVTFVPIAIDDLVVTIPVAHNLPPDPGAAGDATVAGTSTAIPGVRDDVVRDITYAYPTNVKARAALFQMAKFWQYILLYNSDPSVVGQSWSYIAGLSQCFQSAVGNPQASPDDTLLPAMLTTHDRWIAYLNANETVQLPPKLVICP